MADENPKINMALDDIIKLSKPVTQTTRRRNQKGFRVGGKGKKLNRNYNY